MPNVMGRSKRPPSLGRSAGARFTVMRRAGNSKRAFWMAARTRSRASRTSASGRPTMVKEGRPLARCVSTVTSGAAAPASARLCNTASDMAFYSGGWPNETAEHAPGLTCCAGHRRRRWDTLRPGGVRRLFFERGDFRFQRFELFAGAGQNLGLDVEFLAGHEVELGKERPQHEPHVFLEVARGAVGHQLVDARRQLRGNFVKGGGLHGKSVSPGCSIPRLTLS